MTDDGQARPTRPNLTAPALAAIIALAGILLFARFMRGVEVIQCMTLEGHAARVDCLNRLIEER